MTGSTAAPVGASKPYLRRASALCLGLALSALAVCLVRVPALPLSTAVSRCGRSGAVVFGPPIHLSSPPPSPCAPVDRMVGGFSSPPRTRPSSVGWPSPTVVTPRVSSPRGNSATPGCWCPVATQIHRPLPGGTPVDFPPLQRPHPPPPCPSLRVTCEPLWRPCGPRCRPHPQCVSGLIFPPASGPAPIRWPRTISAQYSRLVGV